ncbi:MAG: M50 family metallopeptidase [Candidatus Saccharibacteria bacterium]
MAIFLLIVGLLLFTCLIITHELGHFWLARRNGVEIEEFGIFFPPAIYRHKTKRGWDFTINLLPLGGFVKLKGEHDSDKGRGSYGAASLKAKSKIMIAGIAVNLVTALVLFVVLALIGMPQLVSPQINCIQQYSVKSDEHIVRQAATTQTVSDVEAGSPAAQAGIRDGDILTSLKLPGQTQNLFDTDCLTNLTAKYAGQAVAVGYTHKGVYEQHTVTLRSDAFIAAFEAAHPSTPVGRLGLAADPTQDGLTIKRYTWSAPIVAAGTMGQLTGLTFQGIGKALAGLGGTIAGGVTQNKPARQNAQTEASGQVSGPIGIFFVFKYGAMLGFRFILMVIAVLALTLGVMNLLPIPALDGGRLWLTLIFHAIKKPLNARREELINATGFAVLFGLIILISIVDVKRFF